MSLFKPRHSWRDHVRGIVSHIFIRICILRLVKHVFMDTSMLLYCYCAFALPILEYCSPVYESAAECHLQLLESQVYSVACQIRISCRFVIIVMLLYCVCCTRLIRTRIIDCSVSFHVLLSEFDIANLRCSSSIRV